MSRTPEGRPMDLAHDFDGNTLTVPLTDALLPGAEAEDIDDV